MVFVIAGPCAVESEEQLMRTAEFLASKDVKYLRGGAFKPRTDPDSFQGLGKKGIEILLKARKRTGLKIVTELIDPRDVPFFQDVDVVQTGSRNMQNFRLLAEAGKMKKTVLFKRHFGCTIKEWISASDYISKDKKNIWFCPRGIRTFETMTRNTADIDAIALLKQMGYTVVFDPSHAAGRRDLIMPLSKAAIAAGADGLLIEVHPEPSKALSDREQQLDFKEFSSIMKALNL
jgi:3-deoxy-7-phosphoheptulonate synthase